MESLLIQQNPHWKGKRYDVSLPRVALQSLQAKIEIEEILVLLGIRRSGKSTLFKLIMNDLMQKVEVKSILYMNFDDPSFVEIQSSPEKLHNIIDLAVKITGEKILYLFLDEIQVITGWETYVKSVYDSQVFTKIFVTGSNSKLLSGQYASLLTGRYIKHRIYPLSYKEIIQIKEISNRIELIEQKPHLLASIEEQMKYGSYPKVYLNDSIEI